MAQKPVFVATHPRACSTAFERVFMTRRETLKCVHEPFGDAYYYGPERLAERYADDEQVREKSGFAKSTYHLIMERINQDNTEGKRLFIKDMAQYFFPPSQRDTAIAPSLLDEDRPATNGTYDVNGVNGTNSVNGTTNGVNGTTNGVNGTTNGANGHAVNGNGPAVNGNGVNGHATNGINGVNGHQQTKSGDQNGAHFATQAQLDEVRARSSPASPASPFRTFAEIENPTVVPTSLLKQFQFVFLIRHPRYSIPSYFRCCIPPLEDMTGFHGFQADEAGYEELRRFFDYCRLSGQIGPNIAGEQKVVGGISKAFVDICVLDADDMLDNPEGTMKVFCESAGIDWQPRMLTWSKEDDQHAVEAFEKWKGFHEDAIHSHDLRARGKHNIKSDEQLYNEWTEKYGKEGAEVIKRTVAENVEHYEYLKQFAIKV